MTPWEHVREAERLAAKAEAAPGPVAAMDEALTKARTVGRVYPLDTP